MTMAIVRVVLSIFLIACVPMAVIGAPLQVSSGEHDGFTRLVVTLPTANGNWKLTGSGGARSLRVQGATDGFNVASVFDRIRQDRVGDVTSDQENMRISLNCECTVSAFMHGSRHVVIDVLDGNGTPVASTLPPGFSLKNVANFDQKLRFPYLSENDMQVHAAIVPAHPKPKPTSFESFEDFIARRSRLTLDLDSLDLGLEDAVLRGLLELSPENYLIDRETASTKEQPDIAPLPADDPVPGEQIRVQTVFQNRDEFALSESILPVIAADCVEDRTLDLASWGGDFARKHTELLQRAMTPEPNNDAAVFELARFYIYHGFGLEALQLLSDISASSAKSQLESLAVIIDDLPDEPAPAFANQQTCPGRAALWSVLSEHPTTDQVINAKAISLSFTELPAHMRGYLGPRLVTLLTSLNEYDAAAAVFRAAERAFDEATPAIASAEANLQLEGNGSGDALSSIEAALARNDAVSPQALAGWIDHKSKLDEPIDKEHATLMGAFALEHRNGPLGGEFLEAQIKARMQIRDFDEAFRLITAQSDASDVQVSPQIEALFAERLTLHASDAGFLRLAVAAHLDRRLSDQPETGNLVAKRALALGFPQVAARILRSRATGIHQRDRQLLRAEAALALGEMDAAMAMIAALSGPEANQIRARALTMKGKHKAASEAFSNEGALSEAEQAAWLAQSWESLTGAQNPALANAATIFAARGNTTNPDTDVNAPPRLVDASALIEQSVSSRGVLQDLLTAFAAPDLGS